MKPVFKFLSILSFIAAQSSYLQAAEPIQLKSQFKAADVEWIKGSGDSSISGTAFLKINDNEQKGCAGFNVELLPVAQYSNERIFNIYGNNSLGQILLKDGVPKFTPDHPGYHEFVRKSQCDNKNHFSFKDLPMGDYYVIVFVIWKDGEGQDVGGALMKKVSLKAGDNQVVEIKKG